MRIFLSYGHDHNTPVVLRIKQDLEAAGHAVWIDHAQNKVGDDWRRNIVDGLLNSDWTIGFLSRHSVRSPGACLDELAIALHVKGGTIATVLLESEVEAAPPVSISHIQWLDMHDWAARRDEGGESWEQWYRSKLAEITAHLASPQARRFAGEIARLHEWLRPSAQASDVGLLADGFVGREWLWSKLREWSNSKTDSRLYWISGAPGTGKSAFAGWLAHTCKVDVIALNLCRYNVDDRRDPTRVICTIAFQIATRVHDYRRLLADLREQDPHGAELARRNPAALFDWLLAEPLHLVIDGGRRYQRALVVIDALDETIRDGRSALAEVLAEFCPRLPQWMAFVVTSRPEPAILRQFAGLQPQTISAESPENIGDLRTYAQRWLAADSPGLSDPDAAAERLVAAAHGNFLYLRKLREAAAAGFANIADPGGLPQGLVGLYERWFRRQFPDAAAYDAYRPLLEVLIAAENPVPEAWLGQIFAWSKQRQATLLDGLGSMFERSASGIAPFHKSLLDWLASDLAAGPDFFIDPAPGRARLVNSLWPTFVSWCEGAENAPLDRYCELELPSQLSRPNAKPGLEDFACLLGDRGVIRRRMRIGTDCDEDARRLVRHRYSELIGRTAKVWPNELKTAALWDIAEALADVAWQSVADTSGLSGLIAWEQAEPEILRPRLSHLQRQLEEWNEGVLLLVTAIYTAGALVGTRTELAPRLPRIMDSKLLHLLATGADGLAAEIHGWTSGRVYVPTRNLSFLRGAAQGLHNDYKSDPRLTAWSKEWAELLLKA